MQNKYLLDFLASIMFFTRIPINWSYFSKEAPDLTRAAWSFPLVGFLIGFLSGIFGELFILINIPILLSCVIAISISVIITGAFHEDGFADMADGFGAGGSPAKVNKIMHDSRLGTYGTIALILGILIRLTLVTSLIDLGYSLLTILCAGFSTGKLAIIYTRNFFNPSSLSKTGSIIESISFERLLVATLTWFIPIILIFPFFAVFLGVFFVIGVVYLIGKISKQKLGGITGDILGATAFLTELTFLFSLIIYFGVIV